MQQQRIAAAAATTAEEPQVMTAAQGMTYHAMWETDEPALVRHLFRIRADLSGVSGERYAAGSGWTADARALALADAAAAIDETEAERLVQQLDARPRVLVVEGEVRRDVFEVVDERSGVIRVRSAYQFEDGEELRVWIERGDRGAASIARVRGHSGPHDARVTELELGESDG
jgi:hypothetical protein